MLTVAGGKVDGVAAANDSLANAAITILGNRGLHGVPVTGQDATVAGIQNMLAGDQCMSVYKPVQLEANAAAQPRARAARGHEADREDDAHPRRRPRRTVGAADARSP